MMESCKRSRERRQEATVTVRNAVYSLSVEPLETMAAMHMLMLLLVCFVQKGRSFLNAAHTKSPFLLNNRRLAAVSASSSVLAMSSSSADASSSSSASTTPNYTAAAADTAVPSWSDLQQRVGQTAVGAALNEETKLRSQGKGSAHVQNKLRKFGSDAEPVITLFRDHAGW